MIFNSWSSSLENLETIRGLGWRWLTQSKVNRKVNLDRQGLRAVSKTVITAEGTGIWLEGYGLVRAFKIVSRDEDDEDIEYRATGDVAMTDLERSGHAEKCWAIEGV